LSKSHAESGTFMGVYAKLYSKFESTTSDAKIYRIFSNQHITATFYAIHRWSTLVCWDAYQIGSSTETSAREIGLHTEQNEQILPIRGVGAK
jgi:hypothetical protein